jgi:DNA ligase-1
MDPGTGKLIPFQETMTRKRKHNIEHARSSVPLRFFVFDILYKDGKDLLSVPLSKRREILDKTLRPEQGKHLMISPQIITDNPQILREYHDQQLQKGLEGVVVKKWESPYEPGRRGFSWVKFKEEEGKTGKLTDTIDAVIMGYSRGEGKRSGFGIGMFLVGVRKGDSFVTVTKIGTGVSDDLWKELHTKLHTIKVPLKPKEYQDVNTMFTPDIWVAPKIVVEIAGDDLTRSSTHGAGVAVRFPRLVRIRSDKSSAQATTVSEILGMFGRQKQSRF